MICKHEYLEMKLLFHGDNKEDKLNQEQIVNLLENKYYVNTEKNITCQYCGVTINDEILISYDRFDNNMLIKGHEMNSENEKKYIYSIRHILKIIGRTDLDYNNIWNDVKNVLSLEKPKQERIYSITFYNIGSIIIKHIYTSKINYVNNLVLKNIKINSNEYNKEGYALYLAKIFTHEYKKLSQDFLEYKLQKYNNNPREKERKRRIFTNENKKKILHDKLIKHLTFEIKEL